MSSLPKTRSTPREYLDAERGASTKSDYFRGETFALAGASARHVEITANIVAALHARLRGGGCKVYSSDLRVATSADGLYTYPDVVVVCGEPRFVDAAKDTVVNPVLIVEVLSPATKDYDRGGKFAEYRKIASFSEYLLVAQDECHVEHFVRHGPNDWRLTETDRREDVLELPSVGARLALADVYDRVSFGAA